MTQHASSAKLYVWNAHRYLDEQAFRYNEREGTDSSRFQQVLASVHGKRLTYATLTGKATA